jgi:hypothetical protein
MSRESRIFGHSHTSSQLILRRRVVQTAFLYETECSRNYATEISRLTTHKITLLTASLLDYGKHNLFGYLALKLNISFLVL